MSYTLILELAYELDNYIGILNSSGYIESNDMSYFSLEDFVKSTCNINNNIFGVSNQLLDKITIYCKDMNGEYIAHNDGEFIKYSNIKSNINGYGSTKLKNMYDYVVNKFTNHNYEDNVYFDTDIALESITKYIDDNTNIFTNRERLYILSKLMQLSNKILE